MFWVEVSGVIPTNTVFKAVSQREVKGKKIKIVWILDSKSNVLNSNFKKLNKRDITNGVGLYDPLLMSEIRIIID